MNILHLQCTSAFNTQDFEQCLLTIKHNDALVFIDDGCYCLTHPSLTTFIAEQPSVKIFYVTKHANARAIEVTHTQVDAITMDKLV